MAGKGALRVDRECMTGLAGCEREFAIGGKKNVNSQMGAPPTGTRAFSGPLHWRTKLTKGKRKGHIQERDDRQRKFFDLRTCLKKCIGTACIISCPFIGSYPLL